MITEPISAKKAKELLKESNRAFEEEVRRHATVKRQLEKYNESVRDHCRHDGGTKSSTAPVYDEEREEWDNLVTHTCVWCGGSFLQSRERDTGSPEVVPDDTAGATG